MIKSLQPIFIKNWKIFKEAKTKIDFSRVDLNTWREVGQWPVTTNPFFPLVTRCVIREDRDGYILLFLEVVFRIDKLTMLVLEECDGFTSPKDIKKHLKEKEEFKDIEDIEEKIESILSVAGKYGLLVWIPFGQPHLDRLQSTV